MATTYAALKAQVQAYLERSDPGLVDQIPTFITLAESRCAREIKTLGTMRFVTGSFTPARAVMEKPSGWLATTRFNIATTLVSVARQPLYLRTYDYVRSYWPDSSVTGTPAYYADYGAEHWIIAPTPAQALPFEISYYERPQELSDANQTNWFTANAPDLLLYGALLESAPFLKNDERIAVWQGVFDRAAAALSRENTMRSMDAQTIGG